MIVAPPACVEEENTLPLTTYYTLDEVAEMFGLKVSTLRSYAAPCHGFIESVTLPGVAGLRFTRTSIENFAASGRMMVRTPEEVLAGRAKLAVEVAAPSRERESTSRVGMLGLRHPTEWENGEEFPLWEESEEERQEGAWLTRALAAVEGFLKEHHLSGKVLGLSEILHAANVQVWEASTSNGPLHVVRTGSNLEVVAQVYQQKLEKILAETRQQLRDMQLSLSFLRRKPEERTLPYSEPLKVLLWPHDTGWLVTCDGFPFAARGHTETAALDAFKRTLRGYTLLLRQKDGRLTPDLQLEFIQLRNLFFDEAG
jgi:hypothetical protein